MSRMADEFLEKLQTEKDYYDYYGIELPEELKEDLQYWGLLNHEDNCQGYLEEKL